METIIVTLLIILILKNLFEISIDKNRETGETIIWWSVPFTNKRNFIIL